MSLTVLALATWADVEALDRSATVAVLPVGAIEAHGPHLPLTTDVIIAQAMASEGARRLANRGREVLLLPPLSYTPATFAAGFPGTIGISPETAAAVLVDIGRSLARHGVRCLAIANSHLDPVHLGALHAAAERLTTDQTITVAFPDLTRKPWALRLGDEFKSGACHGGRFETSIVLATEPQAVRGDVRSRLAANPVSLSDAIRAGQRTFEEAGGPDAYFGDPAAASMNEGRTLVAELGMILDEAVAALEPATESPRGVA